MKKIVIYRASFVILSFVILSTFILAAGTSSGGYRDTNVSKLNVSKNPNVTCTYEGETYFSGQSWKKGDGCNLCSCLFDGRATCTKRLCTNKTEINENVRNRIKENCERPSSRQDRILCRLKEYKYGNYTFNSSVIPEACRNETYKERCQSYYAKIRPCYTKEGEAKLACFRRLSGLTNAALNGQGMKKDEMRNYVIALLYDLEQRVEGLNEVDKI